MKRKALQSADDSRQVLPEGEPLSDLPEPKPLNAVARRTVPIGRLTLNTRRALSAVFRELQKRVMAKLEASDILALVAADAAEYRPRARGLKGPVGMAGRPLGDDRRILVQRVWERGPMIMLSELLIAEIDAFQLEAGFALDERYKTIYDAGGRASQLRLGIRPSFDLRDPHLLDALKGRANLLSGGIADDVFNHLKTNIAESFYVKGQGVGQVASGLRKEFGWLSKTRSETIARTETLSVMSEATHTTMTASGVEYKRWLTTLDGKERDTHFEAHGQIQKTEEPFMVGGSSLMYPGDPGGAPEEIMNCRCDSIPVILEDQGWNSGTVWDGANAPDQFAKERRAAAA